MSDRPDPLASLREEFRRKAAFKRFVRERVIYWTLTALILGALIWSIA